MPLSNNRMQGDTGTQAIQCVYPNALQYPSAEFWSHSINLSTITSTEIGSTEKKPTTKQKATHTKHKPTNKKKPPNQNTALFSTGFTAELIEVLTERSKQQLTLQEWL